MTTPTPPDFRALCAELLKGLDENRHPEVRYPGHLRIVMADARAALEAQPEPVGPTEEEILALSQWHEVSYTLSDGSVVYPLQEGTDMKDAVLSFALALLARWGRPAIEPIPVSERLPGPEDCDAEGRCWVFDPGDSVSSPAWVLEACEEFQWLKTQDKDTLIQASQQGRLSWLPHYALPIPRSEENFNC